LVARGLRAVAGGPLLRIAGRSEAEDTVRAFAVLLVEESRSGLTRRVAVCLV
jgi:hypothetical protein